MPTSPRIPKKGNISHRADVGIRPYRRAHGGAGDHKGRPYVLGPPGVPVGGDALIALLAPVYRRLSTPVSSVKAVISPSRAAACRCTSSQVLPYQRSLSSCMSRPCCSTQV